jgi:hypothetical protein
MGNPQSQGPTLDNDALRKGLGDLRSRLELFDEELGQGKSTPENIQAVEHAVSAVRANLWALLAEQHTGDYESYLGKTHVRRATETCEDILADLHAETILPTTPGLEVFHAALRHVSEHCRAEKTKDAVQGDASA